MQQAHDRPGFGSPRVSILTRPESRVQRTRVVAIADWLEFQSSPGPKAGCNHPRLRLSFCTRCFNPHPARKPGATRRPAIRSMRLGRFQSSPGPKAGCNWQAHHRIHQARRVSILTRPESRVQHRMSKYSLPTSCVSILTRPESRVQRRNAPDFAQLRARFNPHPAPKAGCNPEGLNDLVGNVLLFQSSPGPKAGCNAIFCAVRLLISRVSILTRPESRVQPNTQ